MTATADEVMADLMELKLTKEERKDDPIVRSLHHIQCDQMAFRRLEKIKRLLLSQGPRTEVPSDRGAGQLGNDGQSKCEQKPDSVVDDQIEDSLVSDGWQIGTKRQKQCHGGEHLNTWELMQLEGQRRGKKAAVPPPAKYQLEGT